MTRHLQCTCVVVLSLSVGLIARADDSNSGQGVSKVPFNLVIKDELLKNATRELVIQKAHNWHQQAPTPAIRGMRLVETQRNHGNWEKMTLVCDPRGVQVTVDNLIFPSQDRIAFSVHVDAPANLDLEKQTWQNGVQLYGGHCRGRVQFATEFKLEIEAASNGRARELNETRFIFRDARVSCYGFTPEHVNLIGADLALLSGGSFHRTFSHYQGGFEQDMLDLVRAALARACESAEVAAAWSSLMTAIAVQSFPTIPSDTTPRLLMPDGPIGPVVCGPACQRASLTIDLLLNDHRSHPGLHAPRFDVRSVVAARSGLTRFSGMLNDAGLGGHGSAERTGPGNASSVHIHSEVKQHSDKK